MEICLNEPDGFYSSPNSDFIKVLTNSKEHEVVIPDNCQIKPPRLGKSYFSISAVRHDKIKEEPEEHELVEDKNEDIQEYKQMHEKLLNRLDRIKFRLGFPLWLFVGGAIGILITPMLLEIGSFPTCAKGLGF